MKAWQQTLSTTAELMVPGNTISGQFPRIVHLAGASAQIYLGGDSSVDSTDGYPFSDSSSPLSIMLQPGDALWGIAAAGTPTVQLLVTQTDVATE